MLNCEVSSFLKSGFCNLVPQAFPLNSWGKFGTWSESGIWALGWQFNGEGWSRAPVDVFASLWCIQRVGAGRMALSRVTAVLHSLRWCSTAQLAVRWIGILHWLDSAHKRSSGWLFENVGATSGLVKKNSCSLHHSQAAPFVHWWCW